MTVRRRGRFFHYQFIVDGQAYRGTLPTAKDKREARDQEAGIRRSVYDGTYGKPTGLEVFSNFVDFVFMKYSKEHKASWRHDEFRCKVLKEYFAGKIFKQITPMLVEKYIKDRLNSVTMRKKLRSPVTVHKEVALLSSIFNMAMQERVTKENSCHFIRKGVRKNLQARNKRDRFLNQYAPDEEKKLFEQLTGRREYLNAIVRFDLETGLRGSELRALKKIHVNLTDKTHHFTIGGATVILWPNELLVEHSKNGKPRTIPLSDTARTIAQVLCEDATTGEYVFTSPRTGGQLSQIKKGFAAAVTNAGISNFTFHDLRHTFATRLAEKGSDPFTIRDLLGHTTVKMTSDYTHSTTEARRLAIAAMATVKRPAEEDRGKIVATG